MKEIKKMFFPEFVNVRGTSFKSGAVNEVVDELGAINKWLIRGCSIVKDEPIVEDVVEDESTVEDVVEDESTVEDAVEDESTVEDAPVVENKKEKNKNKKSSKK